MLDALYDFGDLLTSNPRAAKKFFVALLSAATVAADVGLLDTGVLSVVAAFAGAFGVYATRNDG